MRLSLSGLSRIGFALLLTFSHPIAGEAAQPFEGQALPLVAYADMADLSDSADVVLRAQIRNLVRVEDERSPGLRSGQGRFYVKARTRALLLGDQVVGDSLTYLVDLPLDQRGRPPKLKKRDVLLFARLVPGRPGELQLVARDAQLVWTEQEEAMARAILTDMVSRTAPPVVTGVREVIYVAGNLAGSGETQIFMATKDGSAASITVRHMPGRPAAWGVSFSELIADVTRPPLSDTLVWYRLACFLPNTLPPGANLSDTPMKRKQALSDYRMVLGELGTCRRTRR